MNRPTDSFKKRRLYVLMSVNSQVLSSIALQHGLVPELFGNIMNSLAE